MIGGMTRGEKRSTRTRGSVASQRRRKRACSPRGAWSDAADAGGEPEPGSQRRRREEGEGGAGGREERAGGSEYLGSLVSRLYLG